MCFAPQRRALFPHRNFQKWSEAVVLCTFWLGNVLRATTACTFSISQLPKVVRHWCVLYILTWKCASRHNGVQFFISHLASWLRTRRFSEPTFRPSGATNQWKNTVFRDFPTFSRICIFFLLTLSLSTLLSSNLSLLSASALLCFSSVHIVGSLTSKLPSAIYMFIYACMTSFIMIYYIILSCCYYLITKWLLLIPSPRASTLCGLTSECGTCTVRNSARSRWSSSAAKCWNWSSSWVSKNGLKE